MKFLALGNHSRNIRVSDRNPRLRSRSESNYRLLTALSVLLIQLEPIFSRLSTWLLDIGKSQRHSLEYFLFGGSKSWPRPWFRYGERNACHEVLVPSAKKLVLDRLHSFSSTALDNLLHVPPYIAILLRRRYPLSAPGICTLSQVEYLPHLLWRTGKKKD